MQQHTLLPLFGVKYTGDFKKKDDWPKYRKKYTYDEVLRMRWEYEYKGKSLNELKILYNIPPTLIDAIFFYKARAWLVPSWDSYNY